MSCRAFLEKPRGVPPLLSQLVLVSFHRISTTQLTDVVTGTSETPDALSLHRLSPPPAPDARHASGDTGHLSTDTLPENLNPFSDDVSQTQLVRRTPPL